MGDPYIPLEKELCLMRRCLEIIDRYNFGATLITKSDLVMRDLDILERINKKTKAVIQMTLTTADDILCRKLEPGVCPTSRRFEVLQTCQKLGIPTVVWFSCRTRQTIPGSGGSPIPQRPLQNHARSRFSFQMDRRVSG